MTTKKTPPKKAPAKRKPRAKQPVKVDTPPRWDKWLTLAMQSALMIGVGAAGGWWLSGGIEITPVHDDVLQQSYDRDRVTQVAVLRELAEQPFDGATDDGRQKAGEWYNANRFKNRASDFGDWTDRVAEAIAANTEADLAAEVGEK